MKLHICLTKHPTSYDIHNFTKHKMKDYHIARAAFLKTKIWPQNYTIKIAFMKNPFTFQGSHFKNTQYTEEKAKWVEKVIKKYIEPFVNLKFEWDVPIKNSNVRISFMPELGSFSEIGTDSLNQDINTITMNLGWLDKDYGSSDDISLAGTGVVIVHEFGHLLGMIHEHSREDANLKWNKNKVYKTLAKPPNNWDKDMVDEQIFNQYSINSFNGSKYDKYSVMEYVFPNDFFINNPDLVKTKYLSNLDIIWMNKTYPGKDLPKGINEDGTGINPFGGSNIKGEGPGPSNNNSNIFSFLKDNIYILIIVILIIIIFIMLIHKK